MSDARKGGVYVSIFLLFLLFLIIGGYFLTVHLTKNDKKPKETMEDLPKQEMSLKIEEDNPYIYFINKNVASEDKEIIYQDIFLNMKDENLQKEISTLNKEMHLMRESLEKISDKDLSEEELEEINYQVDDIYYSEYRNMDVYFYENYASLLMDDYEFSCFDGTIYKESKALVIHTLTGKILTNADLLKMYHMTENTILEKIEEKLNEEEKDEEIIKNTLDFIKEEEKYALYINKSGKLVISYIVKNGNFDYNDVIIID